MRALMKLSLLLVVAAAGVAGVQAQTNVSRQSPSWRAEERQERRADLMRCFELSASLFDDRISPANVVADAVAWHCEAQGIPENYWAILSMRRTIPDTTDVHYRDLALPFVLSQRVRRLQ
jgi:hypothetical protein